ncbi:hypothetical protein D7D52_00005 [Nocardia yunnanensis]|uniref:Uncharacterized protein n=1 Tax=Nocardia yunnanensis TaxID=2382165 RepID=A0A386Z5M6_9NOCA|nr:hypothetical protein D7D52_00005 [Nocardia yunnanensis]
MENKKCGKYSQHDAVQHRVAVHFFFVAVGCDRIEGGEVTTGSPEFLGYLFGAVVRFKRFRDFYQVFDSSKTYAAAGLSIQSSALAVVAQPYKSVGNSHQQQQDRHVVQGSPSSSLCRTTP